MAEFDPKTQPTAANVASASLSLKAIRQTDGTYTYSATGVLTFEDSNGTPLSELDLHGDALKVLTTAQKSALREVMNSLVTLGKQKRNIT